MSEAKRLAARAAVEQIQSGMVVGLGTGSTAAEAVRQLGVRVRAGLRIQGISTSRATRDLAIEEGIELIDFHQTTTVDLTIDGADEVNPQLQLIKGGGAALLWEKIVASASTEEIIVVDASKEVSRLGAFPLPVEVIPFSWPLVARKVADLGGNPVFRESGGKPVVTDQENVILDCHFGAIEDPERLEAQLNLIPGVVENGLFINLCTTLIVSDGTNTWTTKRNAS
jgi:ribose 5-phosphate isomerase A